MDDHIIGSNIDGQIIVFHGDKCISLQTLIDYINNSNPSNLKSCSMCKEPIDMPTILQQIKDETIRNELETKIKEKLIPYSFVNISDDDERCIKKNCMFCPNKECKKPIEKNDGCNIVNCSQCNTSFCFNCGIEITCSHTCYQDLVDLVQIRKLEYGSLNNNKEIREKIEKEENELREKIRGEEDKNLFGNLYPVSNIRFSYPYENNIIDLITFNRLKYEIWREEREEKENKIKAKLELFGTSLKLNKLNKLDRKQKFNK